MTEQRGKIHSRSACSDSREASAELLSGLGSQATAQVAALRGLHFSWAAESKWGLHHLQRGSETSAPDTVSLGHAREPFHAFAVLST